MHGRFKMEYRLFTIVRYNYRDYNTNTRHKHKHKTKTRKEEKGKVKGQEKSEIYDWST